METLIFQLQGTMAAWGEVAVGEYRPSADYPGQSAIYGLLAAALGIDRDDHAAHMALCNNYRIAIGVVSTGRLLRDYHTAQVPVARTLKSGHMPRVVMSCRCTNKTSIRFCPPAIIVRMLQSWLQFRNMQMRLIH